MFHFIPLVDEIGGVPVEYRCRAADAIDLHAPTLNHFRKTFCFPETKNADL
jgi:hypothetical protein